MMRGPSRHGHENPGLSVKRRAPSVRTEEPVRSRRLGPRAAALITAGVGLFAFARAVSFGFVYDDGWTLADNDWLTHPLHELIGLLVTGQALARHVPDATRPVMVLLEALERRVFGLSPAGYHLDSLLLYALVCALATRLALVLTRQKHVALCAGVFFALAPLHAEPVAAINYREDLLGAFGVLGALVLLYAPDNESRRVTARDDTFIRRRYGDSSARALAAGACLALGLFGKESAVAFVPLAGLIAFCLPWARVTLGDRRRHLYVLGAVLFVFLAWRVPLALHGDDVPLAPKRPFGDVLLRAARFEVRAVVDALLPIFYSPDHWRQPDASFRWTLPCLSLFAGVALLGKNRELRVPALGIGFALLAPLACSPLFRPVNELADRYFFLGTLGGGIVWAWALDRVLARFELDRARAFTAFACLPLLAVTWPATSIWRDERSLWTAATELTPASPRAWAGLSRVHRIARERDAADRAMARALNADPNYAPALVTELYTDLAFGRIETAREHLAALDARKLGDGGGIGKARRCAALERDAAAACIGP